MKSCDPPFAWLRDCRRCTADLTSGQLVPRMDWLLMAIPVGFAVLIEPGMIADDCGHEIPAAVPPRSLRR